MHIKYRRLPITTLSECPVIGALLLGPPTSSPLELVSEGRTVSEAVEMTEEERQESDK